MIYVGIVQYIIRFPTGREAYYVLCMLLLSYCVEIKRREVEAAHEAGLSGTIYYIVHSTSSFA